MSRERNVRLRRRGRRRWGRDEHRRRGRRRGRDRKPRSRRLGGGRWHRRARGLLGPRGRDGKGQRGGYEDERRRTRSHASMSTPRRATRSKG